MKRNRLNLDFSLSTNEERTNFLIEYLREPQFLKQPPTEEELETMSNYILWGKDPVTGLNSKQDGTIQLETAHKTWDVKPDESLDALIEQPTFNETTILPSYTQSFKVTNEKFSRLKTRQSAPPHLLEQFEELWRRIDKVDLIINFYDLAHSKRKLPPRDFLTKQFSEEEQQTLKEKASHLNQFQYLKLRHYLVELRREQYTLRDSYITPVMLHEVATPAVQPLSLSLDDIVDAAPLGLKRPRTAKLFPDGRYPIPSDFSPDELLDILKRFYERKKVDSTQTFFDFRELEHVYQALLMMEELRNESLDEDVYSSLKVFLDTLNFYVARATLTDVQREILALKLKHLKNQAIADYVNKKYGKSYTANYISTIFRQKIIPQINAAAALHEKILVNLPYPENFKRCKTCGQTLLIDEENFVRKQRAADGFSTQCKRCDKAARDKAKEKVK